MPSVSAFRDPYTILGVPPDADSPTVTKAYRRLARLYHPDVNTDPGAEECMRQINWAYATLRRSLRQHSQGHIPNPRTRPTTPGIRFRRQASSPWNERSPWRQDWLVTLLVVTLLVVVCPLTLLAGARLNGNQNVASASPGDRLVAPGSTPLPSQDIRSLVEPETEWWLAILTMRPDLPLATADGLSNEVLRVWVEEDSHDLLVETRSYGLVRLHDWQHSTPTPAEMP